MAKERGSIHWPSKKELFPYSVEFKGSTPTLFTVYWMLFIGILSFGTAPLLWPMRSSFGGPTLVVIPILLIVILTLLLSFLVHELGHFFAAIKHGVPVTFFSLFSLTYDFEKKTFERSGIAGAGGFVGLDLRNVDAVTGTAVLKGGIQANQYFAIFLLLPAILSYPNLALSLLFLSAGMGNVFMGLMNRIPFRIMGSFPSDGYSIRWIQSNLDDFLSVQKRTLFKLALLNRGEIHFDEQVFREECPDLTDGDLEIIQFLESFEKGDYQRADHHLLACLEKLPNAFPLYPVHIYALGALFYTRFVDRPEVVEGCLEVLEVAGSPLDQFPDLQVALSWKKGNKKQAAKWAKVFAKQVKSSMYSSERKAIALKTTQRILDDSIPCLPSEPS